MEVKYLEILFTLTLVTSTCAANSSLLFQTLRALENMQQTITRNILEITTYEASYILSLNHADQ